MSVSVERDVLGHAPGIYTWLFSLMTWIQTKKIISPKFWGNKKQGYLEEYLMCWMKTSEFKHILLWNFWIKPNKMKVK